MNMQDVFCYINEMFCRERQLWKTTVTDSALPKSDKLGNCRGNNVSARKRFISCFTASDTLIFFSFNSMMNKEFKFLTRLRPTQ